MLAMEQANNGWNELEDWSENWDAARQNVPEPSPEDRISFYEEQDQGKRKLWLEFPEVSWPNTTAWSSGLFDRHTLPAAHYLDPRGYERMMALKGRTTEHWRQACPVTFAVAEALYTNVPNKTVWGRQFGHKKWATFTQGKWPDRKCGRNTGSSATGSSHSKRRGRWPDAGMAMIDVLNALGNPDRFALGNTDTRLKQEDWADEAAWEFDRIPVTHVQQLRFDVDMERDHEARNQKGIAEELHLEQGILASLGYKAHFFRTGNRGHQIVIPTPPLDRSVASLLVLMIRYALTMVQRPPSQVVIDKSNLDCLLRMPLGRHGSSGSVGWMVDPVQGQNLAPECQAQAVIEAWKYRGSGCELAEADAEMLGLALDDMLYDSDRDIAEGYSDCQRFDLLSETLAAVPELPSLSAFRAACEQWHIRPPGFTTVSAAVGFDDSGADGPLSPAPSDEDGGRDDPGETPEPSRPRTQVGKGWARSIIESGFQPGDFWNWAHASGQNAIGAAIVYCNGDREHAERLLLQMADSEDGSHEDKADRRRWIEWAVVRNNIEVYQDSPVRRDHLDLRGSVLADETERAKKVVDELILRLQVSSRTRRVFSAGALVTLRHLVELIQLEARNCALGVMRLSSRTLDAAIRERWPADATSHRDVSRQLKWVVAGPDCLFCALERVDVYRNAYESSEYIIADEFVAFLALLEAH